MAYELNPAQKYYPDSTTPVEDVADMLTIMSPTDTPLQTLLGRRSVMDVVHEEPIHALDYDGTVASEEAVTAVEGADATFRVNAEPIRVKMQTQIISRGFDVSRTLRSVEHYGINDPVVYLEENQFLSMAKYLEQILHFSVIGGDDGTGTSTNPVSLNVPQAGTNQTNAVKRKMDGLVTWAAREGSYSNRTTPPATGVTHPLGHRLTSEYFSHFPDFVGNNLDRSRLMQILTPAWERGFEVPGCIGLTSAAIKQAFADIGFTPGGGVNERTIGAREAMLIDTIDYYMTPLGIVGINIDRYFQSTETRSINSGFAVAGQNYGGTTGAAAFTYTPDETLVFFMPDMFAIGDLDPLQVQPLAKVGDSTKQFIVGEQTLVCMTPVAICGGTGLVAP